MELMKILGLDFGGECGERKELLVEAVRMIKERPA
jgi:hypothetical protein